MIRNYNIFTESVRDMMKPKSKEDIEEGLDKLPIFNKIIKMFDRQQDSYNNDSEPYYTQKEIDDLVPVFVEELNNVSSDDAIDFLHDYYNLSWMVRKELRRRIDLEPSGYQLQMIGDLRNLGKLYTHNELALLGKKAEEERKEENRKKRKLTESVRDHMKPKSEDDVRKSLDKIPELKDRLEKGFRFGVYTKEEIKKILEDIPAVDRIRDYTDWKIYSEKDYWDMFENGTPREKLLIGVLLNDRWMKNEVLKDVVPFDKVEIGDYLTMATSIGQTKQPLCKILEKYTFNNKEEFKDYLKKHPGILVASSELKTLFNSFPKVKRNAVVVNIGFNMIMEYGSENVVLPYSEEEIEKNKYLGKFYSEEVKVRMHDEFINESVRDMMKPKSDEDIIKSLSHLTPNEKLLKGAGEGIFSLVKNAIEDGADVDTGLQNSGHKWTALFYASLNNYEDIVRYLLSKGASVTNDTLKYTQGRGHNNILKLLKEYQKKQWGLTNESMKDNVGDDIQKLVDYCEQNLNLQNAKLGKEYGYNSITLCIIDAVFSIGINYNTTRAVVKRYADVNNVKLFRTTDEFPPTNQQDSISKLIERTKAVGVDSMASEIYKNRCRTSTGKSSILKSDAVLRFAEVLKSMGVEYLQDLQRLIGNEELERKIKGIPGQTSGISLDYFYMLAGDDTYVKADRMMFRFFNDAIGYIPSKQEIRRMVTEVTNRMKNKYNGLTPRALDHQIWLFQKDIGGYGKNNIKM